MWLWSSYTGSLPRVCLVSMTSCSLSVPSVLGGLGLSWCVCVVCFEDVEEVVDVCLRCCIFDSFPVLLIDVYSVKVGSHGLFTYGFGANDEV